MQFILFLSLARKKKISKRKGPVCTSGTTPDDFQAKGQELATLRQPVLLYAWKPPSASRPYCEAGPAYGKEPPSTNIDVGLAKVPVYAAKVDVYDAKVDVYKFSSRFCLQGFTRSIKHWTATEWSETRCISHCFHSYRRENCWFHYKLLTHSFL